MHDLAAPALAVIVAGADGNRDGAGKHAYEKKAGCNRHRPQCLSLQECVYWIDLALVLSHVPPCRLYI